MWYVRRAIRSTLLIDRNCSAIAGASGYLWNEKGEKAVHETDVAACWGFWVGSVLNFTRDSIEEMLQLRHNGWSMQDNNSIW